MTFLSWTRLASTERRDPVEHDAEMGPVRLQHLVVAAELPLAAVAAGGLDQRPAAERDPPAFGEPRADQRPGEVRPRRGLVPPAGGLEVGQGAGSPLEAVLELAVAQHVQVAVGVSTTRKTPSGSA